ncbi:MAG: 4-hydroxy-tetrahydrodipicolinate synthase [Actinomycetia bacterium]|nr:4-hydroxy-tetrahydrodipicolinate synthase [Actinomycetes bacterium]
MNSVPAFGRYITAMVTPFAEDLSVDFQRAQKLAVELIQRGNEALVICGSTGETSTISSADKLKLFQAVLSALDHAAPVIANVGSNNTADSREFARQVAQLGVDGLLAVVPYYNKPPQEGLYQHFRTIAEAVDIPVILYNIPSRCVINMEASTTLRLARDVPNIRAIKEASGRVDQVAELIAGAPEGFTVYSGDDEFTLPLMGLGGYGVVSTIGNVTPERMGEIVSALASGDHTRALAAHLRLRPLMKELFITANPIMVKAAMGLVGLPVGSVRLPLIEASPSQIAELRQVMLACGVPVTA